MAYRNPVGPEPRGNCSRWLPDPQQGGIYAWPECATLARAFARCAATPPASPPAR
ncbi:hypothetical protein M3P36_05940 [Altererythrobacter sp. KTW20L]|uniref:hypothetical protein n=1 Tax=Altererythrobacter sp. KTW20L TaxID=2942210 RepID=UPI0020C105E9|nr:hypothetical protein [Altererythrobacter sp. KTW20L]MCL6250583.1 hypothetical protein [Altererythrobacter sp. KTW20L]